MIVSGYDHLRSKKDPENTKVKHSYETNLYLKERVELLFKFLMSILLIYVFNPRRKVAVQLDYEMKILLFLFGWILILSANWSSIMEPSVFKKYLSTVKSVVS